MANIIEKCHYWKHLNKYADGEITITFEDVIAVENFLRNISEECEIFRDKKE